MNSGKMVEMLKEIEEDLPSVKWNQQKPLKAPQAAVFYTGKSKGGWDLLAISFDIEDQGFPPGSKGSDGSATKEGTVMHLTRELAERAFKLAEKHELGE
jgi:hypothetical protein